MEKLQIVTDIAASHAHLGILGEAESSTESEQLFELPPQALCSQLALSGERMAR